MTDLLNRPASDRTASQRGGQAAPVPRPVTISAALAAGTAAGATLVTCMAVAVIGWFLADAGAHGQTTDALRVGADAWLIGHGSSIVLSGVPLAMVPMGLTWLFLLVAYRAGRWAGRSSQELDGDRTLALAATIFTGIYVIIGVLTAVLASQDAATPSLGRTLLGTLLVSGLGGGLGLAAGTGRLTLWWDLVPGWVRSVVLGAGQAALLLVAVAALLVAGSLLLHLNEAATVVSELHLGVGDALMYAVVTAAVAPNAVLFGVAYLVGPGFAIGTGTVVSPTAVTLGPVPAFPLLAALPSDGPTPVWLLSALAVPVVVAGLAAWRAQRRYGVLAYDSAALRGFGVGFAAALLVSLLVGLAGGPMGTGRLADVGAPFAEVLVMSVMAMSLGGLAGGLLAAWWTRRGGEEPAERPIPSPRAAVAPKRERRSTPKSERTSAPVTPTPADPDDVEMTIEVPLRD